MFGFAKRRKAPKVNAHREPKSAPLPNGATLTALLVHESTSAMTPYFLFCATQNGSFMKMTYTDPRDLGDTLFDYADTVCSPSEHASVIEADDALRAALEAQIEKYGALLWDGFDECRPAPPGVCDGDFAFMLRIVLSDGTTVSAKGNRAAPGFWRDFRYAIEQIFENNVKFGQFDLDQSISTEGEFK